MTYKEELINSIEPEFIFSKKPINRFKINQQNIKNVSLNKIEKINELKRLINSIHNCSLKNNSKNLVFGEGSLDSSIMIIGEAPGEKEEASGKTFQGEVGALLEKMLMAINIKKKIFTLPTQ